MVTPYQPFSKLDVYRGGRYHHSHSPLQVESISRCARSVIQQPCLEKIRERWRSAKLKWFPNIWILDGQVMFQRGLGTRRWGMKLCAWISQSVAISAFIQVLATAVAWVKAGPMVSARRLCAIAARTGLSTATITKIVCMVCMGQAAWLDWMDE
jgi:hypothetical protein